MGRIRPTSSRRNSLSLTAPLMGWTALRGAVGLCPTTAHKQEIEFKTLETEKAGVPRAEDAEHSNWVRPHINAYVPVGNVANGRAQPEKYAAVPAPQNSRPDAQQSFVYGNFILFAPLPTRFSAPLSAPHAPFDVLYAVPVSIGC